MEVYFDDLKVEHVKSPVVKSQDYYPYGLTFNGYQRENSLNNPYRYNDKEKQEELDLNWLDYGARMYIPEIARFPTIDRYSEKYQSASTYQYGLGDPIKYVDINGDSAWAITNSWTKEYQQQYGSFVVNKIQEYIKAGKELHPPLKIRPFRTVQMSNFKWSKNEEVEIYRNTDCRHAQGV